MGLRDIGQTLPPGFGFYPSDEELVCYYLCKKIMHQEIDVTTTFVEIDLHTCEPWQLPEAAKLNSKEWYFFSFRDRKYATGYRTNRATVSGYWKATGKDRAVVNPSSQAAVGMRKTLVFYKNRAPNGIKTGWVMHEFRLVQNLNLPPKEEWVLCRVFHKSTRTSSPSSRESEVSKWMGCTYKVGDVSETNVSADDQRNHNYVCSRNSVSTCSSLRDDLQKNPTSTCATSSSSSSSSSSIALSAQIVENLDPMELLRGCCRRRLDEYGILLDDDDMMMMSFGCCINGDDHHDMFI